MALNLPNFAALPLMDNDRSGITNALSNYLRGYTSHLIAPRAEEEQRKLELANALSEIQNKYEEPKLQADIAYKQALAQQALQEAKSGGKPTGLAAEYRGILALEQELGSEHPYIKQLKRELESRINARETLGQIREQNIEYKAFSTLTADEKADVLGKYRAMGIGQSDALELYTHKITPELLAAYKEQNPGISNFDAVKALSQQLHGSGASQGQQKAIQDIQQQQQQPSIQNASIPELPQVVTEEVQSIQPLDTRSLPIAPAMTGGNRKDVNDINGALAEDNFLEPYVTEGMKKYSRKLFGYSPQLIKDAMSNDPKTKEDVSWALAIRAINPEISGYRSRLAGGSNAHQALHEITTNSLNGLNAIDFQIDPETYALTQEKISFLINGMGEARKKGISGQIDPQDLKKHLKKQAPTLKIIGITPQGKRVMVPADKIEEFIKKGGKRSE